MIKILEQYRDILEAICTNNNEGAISAIEKMKNVPWINKQGEFFIDYIVEELKVDGKVNNGILFKKIEKIIQFDKTIEDGGKDGKNLESIMADANGKPDDKGKEDLNRIIDDIDKEKILKDMRPEPGSEDKTDETGVKVDSFTRMTDADEKKHGNADDEETPRKTILEVFKDETEIDSIHKVPIFKSVVKAIEENLPKDKAFSKKQLTDIVLKKFGRNDHSLDKRTEQKYGRAYLNYFLRHHRIRFLGSINEKRAKFTSKDYLFIKKEDKKTSVTGEVLTKPTPTKSPEEKEDQKQTLMDIYGKYLARLNLDSTVEEYIVEWAIENNVKIFRPIDVNQKSLDSPRNLNFTVMGIVNGVHDLEEKGMAHLVSPGTYELYFEKIFSQN